MNSLPPLGSVWVKLWLLSAVLALALANPIELEEDIPHGEEDAVFDIAEYLQRLAASRNNLYDSYYDPSITVSDMLRDRRRSSMAENNFQLRVRKRAQDFSKPLAAESNFQLRVRKGFLDRIRESPHIRSSAEQNFQLRVRRKPSSAERNFQLRVRRADPYLGRTLLERIRQRRFGNQAADDNFQLRVRRSPELATAGF